MQTAISLHLPRMCAKFRVAPKTAKHLCSPFALMSYVRSPTISSAIDSSQGA